MTNNTRLKDIYSLYETRSSNFFDENNGLIHKKDSLLKLNEKNNLIEKRKTILPINVNIKNDFTELDTDRMKDYYFSDSWKYPDECSNISFIEIKNILFITDQFQSSADYSTFVNEYIDEFYFKPNTQELLEYVYQKKCTNGDTVDSFFDGSILDNQDLKHNFEQFHFKNISIQRLNNSTREIGYHGAYHADSLGLDYSNNAYCSVEFIQSKDELSFYKELLLDAFTHLTEKNYKMAYFNAFAAFENFVNAMSGRATARMKLGTKFNLAYNNHFTIRGFASSLVFRQFSSVLSGFIKIRNEIAHGNVHTVDWKSPAGEQKALSMYVFSSITMICYENGFQTLDELKTYLKF
ncbi:hypothetical protein KTJ34_13485 [Acinetobacter courvalinii]|uniref:hypothetical protein n=1 Tax=Acinetobacter courvalinii TaxID=280147 RepID=UPI0021D12917|nr:hypothetical protein [Acinetobacter courvalinii]MCU4578437.1 hypothetical protein [Acinetobacter courvalinii]